MQNTTVSIPKMKLIGISCRTNNANEMNPATAQIGQKVQEYFTNNAASSVPSRLKPGITYCAYTNYASGHNGDYDFVIGEVVDESATLPEGFEQINIPAQTYRKFTTNQGAMPIICVNAWQEIWAMSPAELGGERVYHTDFEVYDHRAIDPANTVLDIYVGIR